MIFLVVEEDLHSRKILLKILGKHGKCHLASGGTEILDLYKASIEHKEPFQVIFLDLQDNFTLSQKVVDEVREWEKSQAIHGNHKVKIVITSKSEPSKSVKKAKNPSELILSKPITSEKVHKILESLLGQITLK